MRRTLVIHPFDLSTDFLCRIYSDIKMCSVIRSSISKENLIELIRVHERIIFLGHGDDSGLFSFDVIQPQYYINNGSVHHNNDKLMVGLSDYLEEKDCIFIWCHASSWLSKQLNEGFKIKCFATGMFISEISEARLYDIRATLTDIRSSNEMFANIMAKNLNEPRLFEKVKKEYMCDKLDSRYELIQFNNSLIDTSA